MHNTLENLGGYYKDILERFKLRNNGNNAAYDYNNHNAIYFNTRRLKNVILINEVENAAKQLKNATSRFVVSK